MNRLQELQKNLNIVFLLASAGLVANIDDDHISVDRTSGEKAAYEVWDGNDNTVFEVYVSVYIPATRDTPEDGDAVYFNKYVHWRGVAKAILDIEHDERVQGILENANAQINPDDLGVF